MARQPPPLLPTGTGRMDWRMKKGSPLPVQSSTRRHLMTSEPVRDPLADHLLTPQNCALIIIDYQPTHGPLQDVLPGITAPDRTTINAWEDAEFKQAVRAAGRRKLIMAALWTEACLTFPSLDAMREGYETYPVTDAVGGTSPEAHQAGLDRIAQAGGQPTSVVQVGCELQRDWARQETAEGFTQILFGGGQSLAGASTEPAGDGARAGR